MRQPFYFNWNSTARTGEHHTTIWLSPSVPVQFHYLCNYRPALDQNLITEMLRQANTPAGLNVLVDNTPVPPELSQES